MRKGKTDYPISLAAKRSSLQHDKLVTGSYKADTHQESNSTAFFKNMKNELSNIKNDF